MTDLITRLKSATEGSRELSDDVLRAWGWTRRLWNYPRQLDKEWCWFEPECTAEPVTERPDPSRSVDDAIAGVPGGMIWRCGGPPRHWCIIGRPSPKGSFHNAGGKYVSCNAPTPALALCIAIEKARAAGVEVKIVNP